MTRFEIVTTRGGGAAVLDHDSGEVMHPVIGARREAHELYLEPSRLRERLTRTDRPLVVFDVGLGAGANAAAAWQCSEARSSGPPLQLISFDSTTEALSLALSSDRAGELGLDSAAAAAARAIIEHGSHCTRLTHWRLVRGDLPATLELARGDLPATLELSRADLAGGIGAPDGAGGADIVFWDPFSPRANPALWTCAAFTAARRCCRPGATLHTYSTATSTRSALLLAGFHVGIGAASGAKEQTTVAAVDAGDLDRPLGARFLSRLTRSSRPLPIDAPADAMERLAAHPLLTGAVRPAP